MAWMSARTLSVANAVCVTSSGTITTGYSASSASSVTMRAYGSQWTHKQRAKHKTATGELLQLQLRATSRRQRHLTSRDSTRNAPLPGQ